MLQECEMVAVLSHLPWDRVGGVELRRVSQLVCDGTGQELGEGLVSLYFLGATLASPETTLM